MEVVDLKMSYLISNDAAIENIGFVETKMTFEWQRSSP
jgi:uncharacterized protein YpiB (UPF0302 family)